MTQRNANTITGGHTVDTFDRPSLRSGMVRQAHHDNARHPEIVEGPRAYARGVAFVLMAAMLAACGGGGGVTPSSGGGGTGGNGGGSGSQSAKNTTRLTFALNTKTGTAGQKRSRDYVSRNTAGIGISYIVHTTPPGSFPASSTPTFATAVSPGLSTANTTCTAAVSGAYSCSLLIPAPVGYDDFEITTWDAAPTSGSFAAGANELSTNTIYNQLITQNSTTNLDFTLDGVVASAALSILPDSLLSGGGAQTTALQVLATDADGNIIIGNDPYVDANGNPVTITVTKGTEAPPSPFVGPTPAPSTAGDVTFDASDSNCTNGSISPAVASTCTYTSPQSNTNTSSNVDTLDYNGYELSYALYDISGPGVNGTTTLSVTNTTDGTGGSLGIPGSPTMDSLTSGGSDGRVIAAGAYGNNDLYLGDSGTNQIFQVTPGASPSMSGSWSIPTSNAEPLGITYGPDGRVWFGEFLGAKLGAIDLATSVLTEYSIAGSKPYGLTVGPDSNIWFTDQGNNAIGVVNLPSGGGAQTITEYTTGLTASANPAGIVSDGTDLWFSEGIGNVGMITTGGVITEYPVAAGSGLAGLAYSSGYLWAVGSLSKSVYEICDNPGCTIGDVVNTIALSYTPYNAVAAADGSLYVTERGAIAHIALNGHLTEYTNGVPSVPLGIAAGSDGQIYYTESGTSLYYFAP